MYAQSGQSTQVTDTEYSRCYNKLKELSLKELNSLSATDVRIRIKAFNQKLNQQIETSLYYEEEPFFKWIEENIKSTYFENVKTAKEEWLQLRAARQNSLEENKEYHEYRAEIVRTIKDGYKIIAAVQASIVEENAERLKQE